MASLPAPGRHRRRLAQTSDARLLAAFRAGDEAAFEALWHRHRRALVRQADRVVASAGGDAEGVVQDGLARAHRVLAESDGPLEVLPWLRRVVRNACLDELRRLSVRPRSAGEVDPDAHAGPGDAYTRLSQREDLRRLLEDLADLPETQRSALLMRELDGLAHRQIAAELGVTEQASRALVNRARTNLVASRDAHSRACPPVQAEIATAHDEHRRPSEAVLRHVRGCAACEAYRRELQARRAGLRSLAPALGAGPLAAVAAGLSGGAATGSAALGIKAAAAVGVTVLATAATLQVTGAMRIVRGGPGVRAPQAAPGGRVVIGRPIRRGSPLPSGLAQASVTVTLAAHRSRTVARAVRLRCPPGTRISGLLEPEDPDGALAMYQYSRAILHRRLGSAAGRTATIVYGARPRLARTHVVRVGTLCEAP